MATVHQNQRQPLSDEAAAEIADWLYDFVTDFESAHLHQIRRYRRQQEAKLRDERQAELPWGGDPF
jgi:hypothetical protein